MTTKARRRMSATKLDNGLHESYINKGNTGTEITLNAQEGAYQTVVLNNNATITLTGFLNGSATSITVVVIRDATTTRTLAWAGGTFFWAGGSGPVAPAAVASSLNVYTFFSVNGGTGILANVAGIGYA